MAAVQFPACQLPARSKEECQRHITYQGSGCIKNSCPIYVQFQCFLPAQPAHRIHVLWWKHRPSAQIVCVLETHKLGYWKVRIIAPDRLRETRKASALFVKICGGCSKYAEEGLRQHTMISSTECCTIASGFAFDAQNMQKKHLQHTVTSWPGDMTLRQDMR